jgi:uncharacterized protein YbjT (DUF2867 family)
MRILLTGANGYIGRRLLSLLVEKGHEVIALVRSKARLSLPEKLHNHVTILEGDLLKGELALPEEIDAAYYLVHSMSNNAKNFLADDRMAARNFLEAIEKTQCPQIIYLSGLVGDATLSKHLASRLEVEQILKSGSLPLTTLRTSIIIGSGSASFEIIRDLVEKLPVMIAPKWVNCKCQPIAIVDILNYLSSVLGDTRCYNHSFDIGGPEVITYKEMLLRFAKMRGLRRWILGVPVFTPRLSSYWLIFITSTNYYLAKSLVDSLKNNSVCKEDSIYALFPKKCLIYEEALEKAFEKIKQNEVVSSWYDAWTASSLTPQYGDFVEVPTFGCLSDSYTFPFEGDPNRVMKQIFSLGGEKGYYMNWAWSLRGNFDRLIGGVGIHRRKTSREKPQAGDALDFWRVLVADEQNHRLLLYAEMRLPGEAWLELRLTHENERRALFFKATFRPRGVFGRLYWYALVPMHKIMFKGLGKKILKEAGVKAL